MIRFDRDIANVEIVKRMTEKRAPDFNQLLKVLKREKPDRPTLFEFFLNGPLYAELTGYNPVQEGIKHIEHAKWIMNAFRAAGYDYFTLQAPFEFYFPVKSHEHLKSISLNASVMITDRDSFHAYQWPEVERFDFSYLDALNESMIQGMKAIAYSPSGVLENATSILGYDNMCYLLADDPQLLEDVFDKVGDILLRYYEKVMPHPCIGAAIVNDDWGFNTQTMLKAEDMRRLVVPWHKKFVEVIHQNGKPAIMHSCGKLEQVMDDIIDVIGFDAKHSYEDNILPVEEAYERYGQRIAVLGGLDLNYVCTESQENVFARAKAMLERANVRGGYALGTGNSVPEYVPNKSYYAMILAALI